MGISRWPTEYIGSTQIRGYLDAHKDDFRPWLEGLEQGRVDIKILPYLQGIENGFFVEAGALDGLFMSNTKILEELGWNGLLIEPSPKAVQACRKNRKSPVVECALVSKDYTRPSIRGDFLFDGEAGLGAYSSVNHGVYICKRGDTIYDMGREVRARTLDSIFDEYNITKIDFLSLDVEGYELEVLKGVDLSKVDITYILVEVNLTDYKLEDVEQILSGYENLGCLSGFSKNTNAHWDGEHQDYLFRKMA